MSSDIMTQHCLLNKLDETNKAITSHDSAPRRHSSLKQTRRTERNIGVVYTNSQFASSENTILHSLLYKLDQTNHDRINWKLFYRKHLSAFGNTVVAQAYHVDNGDQVIVRTEHSGSVTRWRSV
uniref:Uncharacterized protein n=1 Tax=Pristionchus pacificus TaxID=54126 RepID=A0A2A6C6L9_PRIPA|eukprot:PDM73671.1 hypothetical protein PRIPAC_41027 [Pristionchus pacificus]